MASREGALERLQASLMAVFGAHRRLRGRDARIEGGVSFAHFQLLSVLAEKGEMSARQLSAEAGLTPATVTQMLDALAEAGIVERTRSETDRRVVLTRLTADGRQRVERKQQALTEKWRSAVSGLDIGEIEAADRVLRLMAAYLDDL
jgi:DNA-binding MarR family transcriptional regulator